MTQRYRWTLSEDDQRAYKDLRLNLPLLDCALSSCVERPGELEGL